MNSVENRLYENSLEFANRMDQNDPLGPLRGEFIFPGKPDGGEYIYLCGNSLGLQPKKTKGNINEILDQWATLGVKGHFNGEKPWLDFNKRLAPLAASIVGAKPEEVVHMNTLSVNLHLMLVTFYQYSSSRYKILMESDVFPSDRYAVESYLRHLSIDPAKAIVYVSPRKGEYCLREEDIINEINKHNSGLSLILLGNTNYYTGQFFDMKSIVKKGHEYDCIVGFDCAHGAGNIPLDLHDAGVDWATWCTYKYLNSSPGNLGGVFIHEKHHQSGLNRLAGWWGQDRTRRFQMREGFQPEIGAEGWQISNPPVIGLAAIETALELHHRAGMDRLREKSLELTGFLEYLIAELNHPRLKIITPLEPGQRGAQLSLLVQQGSAELFQRIMDAGVIADWREPDVIRIAPAPIYNSFKDVYLCVGILANALSE